MRTKLDETKPQHSPLPWDHAETLGGQTAIYDKSDAPVVIFGDSSDADVLTFEESSVRKEKAIKDAALIVRAVNSHEALVEALKEVEAIYFHDVNDGDNSVAKRIRAALSKIEGESA